MPDIDRQILLDPQNTDMGMRCERLLYMASRAQMMAETILPALEQGRTVISDRFVSSTLAYQLGGDGLTAGLDAWDGHAVDTVGPVLRERYVEVGTACGGHRLHRLRDRPRPTPQVSCAAVRAARASSSPSLPER